MNVHLPSLRGGLAMVVIVVLLNIISSLSASAFTGSLPESGKDYYLYNLYQEKFLSYGNSGGTQATLDNSKPLLCTLTKSGDGFTINTHYSTSTGAYDASATSYLALNNGTPVVNSTVAQVFTIGEGVSKNSYYLKPAATTALMFGEGTACVVGTLEESFNPSKSEWMFITEDEYKTYQSKKRFTVASLNVDGMPRTIKIAGVYNFSLNPDGQEAAGATAIGKKLRTMDYDIIGVSEDFNYDKELRKETTADGTYDGMTWRGGIETSATAYYRIIRSISPVFDIDGLCFYYNKKNKVSNESWTHWNDHYGYTSDGADGLIDKGYRYYLVTLEDGTEIDVYIMHMDAETSDKDNLARESQLSQLAKAIIDSKTTRPVIVMGDTNCRYTRDRLKTLFIDVLNKQSNFLVKDAWVELAKNGVYPSTNGNSIMVGEYGYRKGEVVDKVFYINNSESSKWLSAERYVQDLSFVDDNGTALADHWPAVVEFSYRDKTADDKTDVDMDEGVYYLRNVKTGMFLKSGGWWGTHAMQGVYGSPIELVDKEGKFELKTHTGYLNPNGTDPYMDQKEYEWDIKQDGDYYALTYNLNGVTKALTGNDKVVNYGPNTQYVTCADYDASDAYQQWELLTADDLLEEMKNASINNPVNATHLLKGANFDKNDKDGNASWEGWPTKATVMSYKYDDGLDNNECGNMVAEVYVQDYKRSTYETRWNVNQTLYNIPNGRYRVTAQAFYRVNTEPSKTAEVYLYANSEKVKVCQMYDAAQCTEKLSTTQVGAYYYPNSMQEASAFFNKGYYNNTLYVNVTDGTLKVSIGKENVTKESNVWTCFDNFQIEYLGEITDGTYYIYNVEAGQFLTNGNNHNTQASLSTEGRAWTVETEADGYKLKPQGTITNESNADRSNRYLFTANDGLYVDGDNAQVFKLTKAEDLCTFGNGTTFVGWPGDPGNTVVWPTLTANDNEPRGTQWLFLTADEYNQYKNNIVAAASTRQQYWPIRRAAIKNGIGHTSLDLVWLNPASTAEAIKDEAEKLKTAIWEYAYENASDDNPVDVSYFINNAGCGDADHTGWTKTSGMSSNITSEHVNGNIVLAPRFYEQWIANSDKLADGSLKQTLSSLPAGYYKLAVDAIAVKQDGKNAKITGCTLSAKTAEGTNTSVEVSTPDGQLATFTTSDFGVNDNEKTEIGISWNSTNANWIAFDNFRLYYLGPVCVTKAVLPVSIRKDDGTREQAYMGTAYVGFPVNISSLKDQGITAYTANVNGDGTVSTLNTVDGDYIPAYTGLLIKSEVSNNSVKLKKLTTGTAANVDGNLLIGTVNDNDVFGPSDATYFILTKLNGETTGSFYYQNRSYWKGTALEGQDAGTGVVCYKNKAALRIPNGIPAASKLSLAFGDYTTAIEQIDVAKPSTDDTYNLQGQKMGSGRLPQGIYIKGGKKIIVK